MKTIELESKRANDSCYDYMWYDICEYVRELFVEKGVDYADARDIKCYGDVGYNQGRGVGLDNIRWGELVIEKLFKLNINDDVSLVATASFLGNRWRKTVDLEMNGYSDEHERDYDFNDIIADGEDGTEYTYNDILDMWERLVKEIESKALKYGEEYAEEEEKTSVMYSGFEKRKEENNIEDNIIFHDIEYSEKQEDGYIKIGNSGDTRIELWIKPIELTEHTRVETIEEDGITVKNECSTFYTVK